jgi:peptidoglycan-associated lipoprotein
MRTNTLRLLTALLAFVLVATTGCSKKQKTDGSAENSAPVTDTDINSGNADSDSGKAMGLETVHYAYDSAVLDSGAKETLKANTQVLKDKSSLKVQIEGHTDERGGIQYNIALGERRANAAKQYLTSHGISGDRVSVISYGKEKPVDQGHDESAFSKNRRANFRITEK